MELLGDVGHVESCSIHLEMVLVIVQDRCTICAIYRLGRTRWYSYVTKLNRKLVLVHLENSANLDVRSVHGLRQMYHSLKIILDAPDGTPR